MTNSEEQVFDFMAAAEDTGRQLNELVKSIPAEIRATLAAEYRKSPWLAELPKTADRVTAAAERAETAAGVLSRKAAFAGVLVCLAAVVVPLLTWGIAYWQTAKLRREQETIKNENTRLEALAATLKDGTGGGVEVFKDDDGFRVVALPLGVKVGKLGIPLTPVVLASIYAFRFVANTFDYLFVWSRCNAHSILQ